MLKKRKLLLLKKEASHLKVEHLQILSNHNKIKMLNGLINLILMIFGSNKYKDSQINKLSNHLKLILQNLKQNLVLMIL